MNIEARKLRIIELFTSLKDTTKITQIESLLLPSSSSDRKTMINSLAGTWSEEEAEEIKKIIEEGCEKIDESEW